MKQNLRHVNAEKQPVSRMDQYNEWYVTNLDQKSWTTG